MFTNRIMAVVAMLFAAAVVAQPGPAVAQSKVDKAMDVLPSPGATGKGISPGAAKGIVIVDSKPGEQPPPDDGLPPPDDGLPSPGGMGNVLSPGAAKGIIVVNGKPGGKVVSPGALKGFNPQPEPPGLGAHGGPAAAQGMLHPGAKVGLNPQPEPPSFGLHGGPAAAQGMLHPGAKVGLNPQPEPPSFGLHGGPAMKGIKASQ